MVKLVFLGKFRGLAPDDLGAHIPAEVSTLADLKDWLCRRAPSLAEAMAATQTQLVLNHALVRDLSQPVSEGDEVAFLPPMSGG